MILGLLNICCAEYISNEHELYNNIREKAKVGSIKCPDCGNSVGMHGTYKRKVIFTEFDVQTVNIIQVRCKKCKNVHAVIPDFILPKKQYNSETIRKTIEGKDFECVADDSTIRRWKQQVT